MPIARRPAAKPQLARPAVLRKVEELVDTRPDLVAAAIRLWLRGR